VLTCAYRDCEAKLFIHRMTDKGCYMVSTGQWVEFNSDDLHDVAFMLDHHADAIESAHRSATGVQNIRHMIDRDVRCFTRDGSVAPIYAGMHTAVHSLADNIDSNVTGLVGSLRAWADYFRSYAITQASQEQRAAAIVRDMTGAAPAATTYHLGSVRPLTVPRGQPISAVPATRVPDRITD
jgi:hypothetical protein